MIELTEGFFVNPLKVCAVKALDADTCAIFFAGNSPVDGGHRVEIPAEDAILEIEEALEKN